MKSTLFLFLLFPVVAVVLDNSSSNSTESPLTTPRPVVVDVVVENVTSSTEKVAPSAAKEEADPSNATTAAPPTTPAPSAPTAQTFKYGDKPNVNCIQMTVAVQFHLGYETDDGKIAYTTFNAPVNGSTATGSHCGNVSIGQNTSVLVVSYEPLNVTYTFAQATGGKYALTELEIDFVYGDSDLFPGHKNTSEVQTLSAQLNDAFVVSDGKSYRCDVQRTVSFVDPKNSTLEISSLKFVAFSETNDGDFGDAEECSDDFTTSDIVPIAVGCALAALVVIVLIAYLIGRRRSRQRGYQSV